MRLLCELCGKILKNIKNLIFILALFSTSLLWGQGELSPKKQQKFDQLFFDAERFKILEDFDQATLKYEACLKINPKSATVNYELSGLYLLAGMKEKSVSTSKLAVEIDGDNYWFRLRYIAALRSVKDVEEIIVQQKFLVNQYPNRVDFKLQLAKSYLEDQQYQNCINQLTETEKLEGITPYKSTQKRDLYILLNNADKARVEVEKLSEAHPQNIEYLGILAEFYNKYGPNSKIEPTYLKMIELEPEDPRALLNLAIFYRTQNRQAESATYLKLALVNPNMDIDPKIAVLMSFYEIDKNDSVMSDLGYQLLDSTQKAHPNNPKIYAIYSDFLIRDNRKSEAIVYLRKSVDLGATQRQVLEQLILLDLENSDFKSMKADSEMALELYPNQPFGYLMHGIALSNLKEYEASAEILESGLIYVIRNDRLKEQFYLSLADAYHNVKDHFNSDAYFEKALALNENNFTVLNNYAYYLSVRGEKLNKALEMIKKCNLLSPNNPVFLDTWAWVLYKQGQYQQALEKMELVTTLMANPSGDVFEHLGDILYKLDRKDEALINWQKAKKLGGASTFIDKKIKNGKLYE